MFRQEFIPLGIITRRRKVVALLLVALGCVAVIYCLKRIERKEDKISSRVTVPSFAPSKAESQIQHPDITRTALVESRGFTSVATVSVKMASHTKDGFDALRVYKLFISCRTVDDVINLDCYIDAYEELCKLFRLFGTIFSFVTSDVEEKIGILRDFRKSENAEQYKSVQSMLQFEVSKDLTKSKKHPSGARTLLRLHRALEFISAFLQKLKNTDNSVKFSSAASAAYDDTLSRHHPWLIRKAVHVAMYMLPTRQDLLKKMGVEDNEAGMQGINDLIHELNTIFSVTEELYKRDDLLDLP
ncbi:ceramide-1-phosphate transfer protein-like [Physella acuta]|uniref:ceramide-1-phosphate transfer protein-like n=1 Tax=Physella acuta TaxID=109671 RepID=UPI0027DB4DE0|nr:ceramide-1-phosphate transfer protein-like [Physella acuta]XP_059178923.1 ceramide-1-phosphate transfer protein-like [Physella acuta]